MLPNSMFDDMQDAFLNALGLAPLSELAVGVSLTGASRLLSLPPFEPIRAITLQYLADRVVVHLAISDDDAWERVACGDISEALVRLENKATFAGSTLPEALSTWPTLLASLENAKSCISANEHIGPHFHYAIGESRYSQYSWFNPDPSANGQQCLLIQAYQQIAAQLE